MAVTDLTGTKWLIDSTPISATVQGSTFSINFTSDNTNFISIQFGVTSFPNETVIYYNSSSLPIPAVYDNSAPAPTGAWSNQAYRTIEITGGTDATNASLIAWLQQNATQITEPEITDLTGTTWLFGESISEYAEDVDPSDAPLAAMLVYTSVKDSEAEYWADINFSSNGQNFVAIGGEGSIPLVGGECIEVWNSEWVDESYRTITITGGAVATNASFIAWLEANAEQIIEPTANEYTLTQNLTNLTSGNITLTITADEGYSLPAQADIVVTGGTIVSYDDTTGELVVTAGTTAVEVTCESAVSTISFSIDNITYQAEDGMTWAQWCDSAYNTDGCYIANGGVYRANAIDSHLRSYSTNGNVLSTDTIVENGHYYWSSGGSND